MSDRYADMFVEPCDGEVTYTERTATYPRNRHRYLAQRCSCGTDLGTHLLKNESEIFWHSERVITVEDATANMADSRLCHRKGVVYDAYMGFWHDGEEMTEEEYVIVRERLGE